MPIRISSLCGWSIFALLLLLGFVDEGQAIIPSGRGHLRNFTTLTSVSYAISPSDIMTLDIPVNGRIIHFEYVVGKLGLESLKKKDTYSKESTMLSQTSLADSHIFSQYLSLIF